MFTVEKIQEQFGHYYNNENQNVTRILNLMRQKTETTLHAKPIVTEGTLYRFANTKFGKVVQQFQKKFTPKGGVTFRPREIKIRQMKVDDEFYPDDITESWLGFLSDKSEAERKQWPIVRWMIEEYLLGQVPQDMEMDVYGKGVYKDPVDGTAGNPEDSLDGLIKLCDDGIKNAEQPMNSVLLKDKITVDNAVDQLEEYIKNIPRVWRNNFKFKIFMDPEFYENYQKNYRKLFSKDPRYTDDKASSIDFNPKIELIPLASLSETNTLIATPEGNFVHIKRKNGTNKPSVESSKRLVSVFFDWWEALGFGYNELVWYYKQAV